MIIRLQYGKPYEPVSTRKSRTTDLNTCMVGSSIKTIATTHGEIFGFYGI